MVIETNRFRLVDGVDDAAFLEADEQVRTGFLYQRPGIVRATTAKSDDDEWIVIVLWASDEDADAAADAAQEDAAVKRLEQLVVGMQRTRYHDFG
jgi:heme-degrading monooxygenase HmoA